LRVSAACWFDAAYAIIMEAPHEALDKMLDHLVRAQARAEPNRETWGLEPGQQRLMAKAAAAANTNPMAARKRGDGRPM
jgi:hypothetical protein